MRSRLREVTLAKTTINFGTQLKKSTKAWIYSLLTVAISSLIIPGILERSKNTNSTESQAFIEHYIPTTKKGDECLAADQQLLQESSLLAGTAEVAHTELKRIAQKNFKAGAEYEVIISAALKNFSASQTSYAQSLKVDQDCWRELSRQMEQTALALNVHREFKTPNAAMVSEENAINTSERALVEKLRNAVDMKALYENFVSFTSTTDEEKMRGIFPTINPAIESLVAFYGEMIGITQQRTALKQKYYLSKKEIFSEKIDANRETGFFKMLWPF